MISSSLHMGIPAATCEAAALAKFLILVKNEGASVRARSGGGGDGE
jgi:hypothetical protein